MITRRRFATFFAGLAASTVLPASVYGKSKIERQRELLEDAVIIHRIGRTPSRKVWYVEVNDVEQARRDLEYFRTHIPRSLPIPASYFRNKVKDALGILGPNGENWTQGYDAS
jgi:SRSO17 transposase